MVLYDDDKEDPLWDAVWNVAARKDSAGWTAEFRIPLSQLRYDVSGASGAVRPWRINFSRTIAATQPIAARLRFVKARDVGLAAGGDIRLKLPQSLTLTATVNPDFGQVEADPAVVNLSAFEIFFPERRPFFLENAVGFAFGKTRTFNDNDTPIFFYTQRIGRPPQRTPSGRDVVAAGLAAQTPILGAL